MDNKMDNNMENLTYSIMKVLNIKHIEIPIGLFLGKDNTCPPLDISYDSKNKKLRIKRID